MWLFAYMRALNAFVISQCGWSANLLSRLNVMHTLATSASILLALISICVSMTFLINVKCRSLLSMNANRQYKQIRSE